MNDDRLQRWLGAAGEPLAPDTSFADGLRRDLRVELGFDSALRGVRSTRPRTRLRRRPASRWQTALLVAATLALVTLGALGLAGTFRQDPMPTAPSSLLAIARERGEIRIAVRPDHPQAALGGAAAVGFDVDIANELAARLRLRLALVIVPVDEMLDPARAGQWDLALPSLAAWRLDPRFAASTPYYHWPHRLVVASGSAARDISDVEGQPICAVAGDAGEQWLRGEYPAAPGPLVTAEVTTRESDDECRAALLDGTVVAFVTARLSDAELDVRDDLLVIGGPAPEPRPAVALATADGAVAADLLAEVDRVLEQMRRDGTIARLSSSRFGADLTTP